MIYVKEMMISKQFIMMLIISKKNKKTKIIQFSKCFILYHYINIDK